MRQIFNKKQLIVIWLVAIVICFFIAQSSIMVGQQVSAILGLGKGAPNWIIYFRYGADLAINWLRLTLIPIIIGALLVITLGSRRLDEEEIEKKSRKLDREQREAKRYQRERERYQREREQKIKKIEQKKRERDNTFLMYWEHGMSDKELAKKFHLKIKGVRTLKEKLNGRRRKKTPGTGPSQDKSGPYPEGRGSL